MDKYAFENLLNNCLVSLDPKILILKFNYFECCTNHTPILITLTKTDNRVRYTHIIGHL